MKKPTVQEVALISAGAAGVALIAGFLLPKVPIVRMVPTWLSVPAAVGLTAYTFAQNRPASGYALLKG